MECKSCGACCRYPWVVEVTEAEAKHIPKEYLNLNCDIIKCYGAMRRAKEPDGACSAWDWKTMLCKIYDVRPSPCREFKEGGVGCKMSINWVTDVRIKKMKCEYYD